LLKWLGEAGKNASVVAAVAISVPFLLDRAADKLQTGFSRIYQWDLLRSLRAALKDKRKQVELDLLVEDLATLTRMRDFDTHVTARLHGFRDADHYYAVSSSRPFLKHIAVPTLLIQAHDDPFMTPDVIPARSDVSSSVMLDIHPSGGHVGFVMGAWPWQARYWIEERVPEYLAPYLSAARTALAG
jgi:uncharacterized protein